MYPHRLRGRCGRFDRPGLGRCRRGQGFCTFHAPPRLHPDGRPFPHGGGNRRPAGIFPGGAGKGAFPGGNQGHPGMHGAGNRNLCPRGPLYEYVRPVLHERHVRREKRQPGPVRPALPPALLGGMPVCSKNRGERPVLEGHVPGKTPAGAGGHGDRFL